MRIPAIILIARLYLTRKVIIFPLKVLDTIASTNKGNPMPRAKTKKLIIFSKNAIVSRAFVKKAAIKSGLQGITIAPKKNPKRKAFHKTCFVLMEWIFGRNLPISMLNIRSILIILSNIKAIGETIPMIFVREICKR